ncbi:MAG: hypothetical protein ACXAAH_00995 [Promethearchaeota archaeon]
MKKKERKHSKILKMRLPFYKRDSTFTKRLVSRINELDLREYRENISPKLKTYLHCYKLSLVEMIIKRKQKQESNEINYSPALQKSGTPVGIIDRREK